MSDLTEYFLRHLTLVLDNEPGSHGDVTRIAQEFIQGESVSMEGYRAMSSRTRSEEFADGIGEQILEYVTDQVDEVIDGGRSLGCRLIGEIMIGSDSALEWALGNHYMPEVADMEGLLDDEDECEGHESNDPKDMGETVYCDGSCLA